MTAVAVRPPSPVQIRRIPDRRAPRVDPGTLRTRLEITPDQGVLAFLVPGARPRPEGRQEARTATDDFGPRPTPTRELPDAREWAGLMGLTALQVAVGIRPAPQIRRHVASGVYDSLARRQVLALRRRTATRRPMRVRRVVASEVRDGVVEASVVVEDAHRTRAIALRLTGQDGRWLVTALELG